LYTLTKGRENDQFWHNNSSNGLRMASFSIIMHQMHNWNAWLKLKILQNKITGTQTEFHLVFFFFLSTSTAATYIFTALTRTITRISLKTLCVKCWVSAVHYFAKTNWKTGQWVKAGPKTRWRQGDFTDNSNVNF
jgi:hypothetical protein